MITGIIVNDYRNDHRTTKRSSAPIQKEWPALEEMMGWWLCEEVLMVVVFLEKVKEKVEVLVELLKFVMV